MPKKCDFSKIQLRIENAYFDKREMGTYKT